MELKQKQLPVLDRHMMVINHYLTNGLNKYKAMIDSGYSKDTAIRNVDVFQRRDVKEEIERRMSKMSKKAEIDADYVIAKFKQIVEADLGDILTIQEDGTAFIDMRKLSPNHLAALGEFSVDEFKSGRGPGARDVKRIRIKFHDKLRALEALGRHLGLFNDKLTIKGEVDLIERIQRGRKRSKGEGEDDESE